MELVKIISHKDISHNEMLEICDIKSVFGDYTVDSQLSWMHNNLKDDDTHFLLFYNDKLVAYLNLIKIEFEVNGRLINGLGIGNVCSKSSGKGFGSKIMKELRNYIQSENIVGLLFCKDKLVKFYKRFGWRLLDSDIVNLGFQNDTIKKMIFNYKNDVTSLKYSGKSF